MDEIDISEDDAIEIKIISTLLGNGSIDEAIDFLTRDLDELQGIIFKEANTKETLMTVGEKISSGKINKAYMADEHFNLHFTENKLDGKAGSALRLAFVYTYFAIELKEHSRIIRSWHAVSEARKYIGYCFGLYDPSIHTTTNRAQKGGNGKSRKNQEVKEAVIEALLSMKQKKGWKSTSAATDAIIDRVLDSLKSKGNRFANNRDDLIAEIRNMLEHDKEVRAACESPFIVG